MSFLFCCGSRGNRRKHETKIIGEPVDEDETYTRTAAVGTIRVLVVTLDYNKTEHPLTCSADGRNIHDLAKACGIADVTFLNDDDEPLMKNNVKDVIAEIAGRCEANDFFVFYYSGHGTVLKQSHGCPKGEGDVDEHHEDDAYCFQNKDGNIDYHSCMADYEICDALTLSTPETVRMLIMSDCCHSDTIADFGKPAWTGREAVSISGCLDSQTSGDTGKGGIMTHSMLKAVEQLCKEGNKDYSIGRLFNQILKAKAQEFPEATQQVCFEHVPELTAGGIAWPFLPKTAYKAPISAPTKANCGHVRPHLSDLFRKKD